MLSKNSLPIPTISSSVKNALSCFGQEPKKKELFTECELGQYMSSWKSETDLYKSQPGQRLKKWGTQENSAELWNASYVYKWERCQGYNTVKVQGQHKFSPEVLPYPTGCISLFQSYITLPAEAAAQSIHYPHSIQLITKCQPLFYREGCEQFCKSLCFH